MKTWKTRGRVGEDREGGDKGEKGKKEYNTEGRKKRGGEGGREREKALTLDVICGGEEHWWIYNIYTT